MSRSTTVQKFGVTGGLALAVALPILFQANVSQATETSAASAPVTRSVAVQKKYVSSDLSDLYANGFPARGRQVAIAAPRNQDGRRYLRITKSGAITAAGKKVNANTRFVFRPAETTAKRINPGSVVIMNPDRSEEKDAYCVQSRPNGTLALAVCRRGSAAQTFNVGINDPGTFMLSGQWGGITVKGHSVGSTLDEELTVFTAVS